MSGVILAVMLMMLCSVNGVLAITRAFGDVAFKDPNQKNGIVISTPDIYSETITPMTEFAILASDGLWDVIPPQAAVNFVRKKLSSRVDLHEVAKSLALEAIAQGSIDNVTVLVMSFHMPCTSGC